MTSPTALTVLRAVAGGAGSLAPVHAALGTVLDTIEPGLAVARVPRLPPHRLRGPGVVPVLGDLVLSAAITSSLAAGLRISTLTLHTAMLGPLRRRVLRWWPAPSSSARGCGGGWDSGCVGGWGGGCDGRCLGGRGGG